jgi:SAM-dependent methyltransferase
LGYADVRALDWSERALAVAAELGRRLGRQLGTLRWKAGQPLPPGPWDLITAGHLTNELFRGTPEAVERRADLVMSWLDALAPDGRLVLLEPASHTINREFLMLRDRLVEHSVPVLAPCFFRGPCPAVPASAACHGELRWDPPPLLQRIATAGRLDREAMGFSWLVLGKPGGEPRPDPPAGAVRVVSEQMLNKAGRQRFVVCGADGRFSLSAPKDHRGTSWGPAWRALGRGDAVVVTEPEAREAGWGLGPTTRLRPMD